MVILVNKQKNVYFAQCYPYIAQKCQPRCHEGLLTVDSKVMLLNWVKRVKSKT